VNSVEAFPLCWPVARARTPAHRRDHSRFQCTFARARDGVREEVRRLGGKNLVISTDVPLRQDGLPYAARRTPDDPGAAVYFTYQGEQVCFACDRWLSIGDNLRAIEKTIEALRGIARWGTGDMLKAAFRGFAELPAPGAEQPWWEVAGVDQHASSAEIEDTFRRRLKEAHPDRGGNAEEFHRVMEARDRFRREVAG